MQKQTVAVYIGKFQILHNAHYDNIQYCLDNYDQTMIIVGSTNKRISPKYPFSYEDIKNWIKTISKDIVVEPSRDYIDDEDWFDEIREIIVSNFDTNQFDIRIIGHEKDETSYYLNHFKDFGVDYQPSRYNGISATDIRKKYFSSDIAFKDYIPDFVYEDLMNRYQTEWCEPLRPKGQSFKMNS